MRSVAFIGGRAFRALYVFWLTFVLTQPVPVHACPLRNVASGSAQTHNASDVARQESAQRILAHGGALCEPEAMGHGHEAPSPGHHQGMATCHCVGDCCVAAIVTPVAGSAVPMSSVVAVTHAPYVSVGRSYSEPAYHLPPSTAPPVVGARGLSA